MFKRFIAAGLLIGSMASMPAFAQSSPAQGVSRGELLYTTHCIACHDTSSCTGATRKAAKRLAAA